MFFKTDHRLMQVKSIAECSKGEHSAILSTFIKQPVVIKTFVLWIFEWPFYTGYIIYLGEVFHNILHAMLISAFAGHAGATLYTQESVSHGVLPVLQLPCFNK